MPVSITRAIEKRWRFLERPGAWLWIAIAAGAVIRAYLVLFTEGTLDVQNWEDHARGVREAGLIGHYHQGRWFNHPPLISEFVALLSAVADRSGIPFRVWFRMPFALVDVGCAWLLLRLLRENRYRYVVLAAFWLHPLAMLISSYHGNSDNAIAFFLLASVALAGTGRSFWTGAALGMSLWIKVPGVLAAPALFFSFPRWRQRLAFTAATVAIGAAGYLPPLAQDPQIVFEKVFAYRGVPFTTPTGAPVWGVEVFFSRIDGVLPDLFGFNPFRAKRLHHAYNTLVFGLPLLAFSWLRRGERTPLQLGCTLAGVYVIFCGFTSVFAFHYFAWSVPLWFLVGPRFAAGASVVGSAYVYSVYAMLCGNPLLLGTSDLDRLFYWPTWLLLLRDLCVLFFFLSACVFLYNAIVASGLLRWRRSH